MADAAMNKLSAKILKAEMLGDRDTVIELKTELAALKKSILEEPRTTNPCSTSSPTHQSHPHDARNSQRYREPQNRTMGGRVKKFVDSTTSLSKMFVDEKHTTSSDEAKLFMKTAKIFSKEDMDTKYFAEEVDDSQSILNQSKKHKTAASDGINRELRTLEICSRCFEKQAKHMIIDKLDHTFLSMIDAKPFLSTMSNTIIRNDDHSCSSFVSSSPEHQQESEKFIEILRETWKSEGYRCIIMETYLKNRHPSQKEVVSCEGHFQLHCLPIKEKHYERARMSFKYALQSSESEWSLNNKLIRASNDRRIQRHLPIGLSYFWVCFDDLKNGFGHVIENEQNFSRFFGFEVLSGLLDRDFNPMKLNDREEFTCQFERCRDFKILYSKYSRNK